jgi:hypothetical protein
VVALPTGSYSLTYTINPTGTTSSECGSYSMQAFILKQGGLYGSYYTNKWFSGTPYLTQIDTQINKNWGTGDIIPNVASNYVSIEWVGYILPLYSESYTFKILANDGARVYVND